MCIRDRSTWGIIKPFVYLKMYGSPSRNKPNSLIREFIIEENNRLNDDCELFERRVKKKVEEVNIVNDYLDKNFEEYSSLRKTQLNQSINGGGSPLRRTGSPTKSNGRSSPIDKLMSSPKKVGYSKPPYPLTTHHSIIQVMTDSQLVDDLLRTQQYGSPSKYQ
eukprot:TRINITY_DN3739_c0_g1_i1.p1 TRINITY_DN3739_c0_g1~~TRINITY_DN3739_c0_g1_i1.p1  ORF type:complete len:163 (+),score=47.29 TRINITY_DN3739_c0_g1_i1:64-552(+)